MGRTLLKIIKNGKKANIGTFVAISNKNRWWNIRNNGRTM